MIFLSVGISVIVALLYIVTSDNNIAQGQNDESELLVSWDQSRTAQSFAIIDQTQFSTIAQELQTKITERDTYLTGLLQTLNSNPPTEGTGEDIITSECVIATAAFGSNLAPQVQFLRDFRDDQIKSTLAGSSFMQGFTLWYYSFSPTVAEYERGQPWLQQTVRVAITPLLSILQLSENGYSLLDGESGAIIAGIIASSLIGLVYFSPIAFVILSRRSGIIMNRLILFALIVVGASGTVIATGILLENSGMLIVATVSFVLGILVTSATSAAKAFHMLVGRRRHWNSTPLVKRRLLDFGVRRRSSILIIAIICSSTLVAALGTSPVQAQQSLSRDQIEDQLRRLSEIKIWLEDTRRIESFFPDVIETRDMTNRLADFIREYNRPGTTLSDAAFIEGVQGVSTDYQRFSSKIYNDGVSERHFTLKDTLSSAVLQLSYSTADMVRLRTCDACNAEQAHELYLSSQLALQTSSENFYTYTQLLQSEHEQIQTYITEIESMPNSE